MIFENNILARCCDTVRRFTREQETVTKDFTPQEMWEMYHLTGNEEDLNNLLVSCLGLITSVIMSYDVTKTETEELFSIAMEETLNAARLYSVEKGIKFSTYMITFIRNKFYVYFHRKDIKERIENETSLDARLDINPNLEFMGENPIKMGISIPLNKNQLSKKHFEFIQLVEEGYSEKLPDIAAKMNITLEQTKEIKEDIKKVLLPNYSRCKRKRIVVK